MPTIDDLIVRLNKQAAAIRDLRRRVAELEGAVPEPSGTDQPGITASTFKPRRECIMCGKPKEPGRKALSCKACSAERNRIITGGEDREPLMRTSCFNCGKPHAKSVRWLCVPCGAAFKLWKSAKS